MEFNKRQLKWYWLILFILYCGIVIAELFHANPYLYSHNELRGALTTDLQKDLKPFPVPSGEERKTGDNSAWPRWGFQHLAADTHSPPRNKNLIEYKSNPIVFKAEDWAVENVGSDASGFYLTGRNNWVVAVGLDGAVRWSFAFLRERSDDKPLLTTLLDEQTAYAIHPDGEVVALSKAGGELLWSLPFQKKFVAAPFLWKEFLVVPMSSVPDLENTSASSRPGVQWTFVSKATGEIKKVSEKLDLKEGFQISYGTDLNQFYVNADNKIVALDPETLQPVWTQTLTDPIKGSITVNGNQIYAATLGAKAMALDASKKGKVIWEVDLLKPAAAPVTVLPIMNKLSVPDESGTIHVLDAKTGKELVKVGLEGHSHLPDTWSARLKSQHIDEYKMDWLHKGWTIWAACDRKRVCIFSPKGILISKISLSGAPLAFPIGEDTRQVYLVQTAPHAYAVTQLMDEKEIKRLKAEEAGGETVSN